MNKIIVMGRLTKDPEVRYTPSQKVVCSFTLAVDRPFLNQQGQREADFIPVVVWGKAAELCGNSLAKGHRLLVEGRLQIRNFDAKDGTKHWVTEIIAANVEFVERKSDSANRNQQPYAGPETGVAEAAAPMAKSPMSGLGSDVPFDEEVPF
jgi:single-strand DNA-binding protein